jgi:hypothetical protein
VRAGVGVVERGKGLSASFSGGDTPGGESQFSEAGRTAGEGKRLARAGYVLGFMLGKRRKSKPALQVGRNS